MGKLIPLLLILAGIGGGAAAGLLLRPAPDEVVQIDPCGDSDAAAPAAPEQPEGDRDYVKMNNQFVVPVMRDNRIGGLVVLSLSLEVGPDSKDKVYAREPKLRDVFLQVLFDHANTGGFAGAFTDSNTLDRLRRALLEVAVTVLDGEVSDVLITDIARQDTQ